MTRKRNLSKLISFSLVIFALIFFGFVLSAKAQEDCGSLEECQALLKDYEKQILEYEGNINKSQLEQKTLNNKIYLLKQQISKIELEVKKSTLIIKDLEVQIGDTKSSIQNTSDKIGDSRVKLAEILRTIHEEDQKTTLEILLSGNEISDFFDNLVALESLLVKNRDILENIKALKAELETQQTSLNVERGDWENMKKVQILQKEENQKMRQEKEWLLSTTKGEEKKYQELLAESRAQAKKIRERIFSLIGVPEAPTFGQALEMAKYVEIITGVRPAFLLAVLTQESDIGKNVGQCYLKNVKTGAGTVFATGQTVERVMKPGRDVEPFLAICRDLGRDPFATLISCPMSFGWGGAMGPAQFIPSTWNGYRDQLSSILGKPADPWSVKDAFLAAALYLKDAGAGARTYNAEWRAAMIYFSGSTNPSYSFYGNRVMKFVVGYEDDIAQLEKYSYAN